MNLKIIHNYKIHNRTNINFGIFSDKAFFFDSLNQSKTSYFMQVDFYNFYKSIKKIIPPNSNFCIDIQKEINCWEPDKVKYNNHYSKFFNEATDLKNSKTLVSQFLPSVVFRDFVVLFRCFKSIIFQVSEA